MYRISLNNTFNYYNEITGHNYMSGIMDWHIIREQKNNKISQYEAHTHTHELICAKFPITKWKQGQQ